MSAITSGAVNHIALTVTDRDRSREFYTTVLGFQFVIEFGPKYLLSNNSVILALNPAPDRATVSLESALRARRGCDPVHFPVL